jgi:hypothetical protein
LKRNPEDAQKKKMKESDPEADPGGIGFFLGEIAGLGFIDLEGGV